MYWQILFRTSAVYLVVLIVVRTMGKREIGQLSPFDLVIAIMIGELAAIALELDNPLTYSIFPIIVLAVFEFILSYLSLKSYLIRRFIDGVPTVVIENGKILEKNMRQQRYNVNDLLGQLREQGVGNVSDVEYAILETSGKLSVILKSQKRPVTPADLNIPTAYEGLSYPLIVDGEINRNNLKSLGISEYQLEQLLDAQGVKDPKTILLASIASDGSLYISLKSGNQKRSPLGGQALP